MTPQQYNLPHKEWRPYQEETIESILGHDDFQVQILQAATGFGKSAVAAALGSSGRSVMSLTRTISLQEQYKEAYDFKVLKGMSNYPCELSSNLLWADSCTHIPRMYSCPVSDQCRYLIAREIFQRAKRRSLNYDYYLLANWLSEHQTTFTVGDEAHRVPEILSDHYSLILSVQDCYELDIPIFPKKNIPSKKIRLNVALSWIDKCLVNLHYTKNKLQRLQEDNPEIARKIQHLETAISKFSTINIDASQNPDNWFVSLSDEEIKIVPLSVSDYFKREFLNGFYHNVLLMSATIGNHETYSSLIGLDSYYFHDIPSRFSPEERAVHVMVDCPAMSYRSSNTEKDKQADCIADAIKSVNPSWAGIIHVSSKAKQKELANRLARRGLQDRVFIPKGRTTGDKLEHTKRLKKMHGNPIILSYSLGEGVDLGDFDICLSGDTPFPYIGDSLGRTRMEYDKKHYFWKTGIDLVQRLGRTRRGREKDYGKENGFVAICDMSVKYVEDQLSDDFKSTLVAWQ